MGTWAQLQLVVRHSCAVYFLMSLCVILEALIEGWRGSCIRETRINIELAVKHGVLELDVSNNSVLEAFIELLCTT